MSSLECLIGSSWTKSKKALNYLACLQEGKMLEPWPHFLPGIFLRTLLERAKVGSGVLHAVQLLRLFRRRNVLTLAVHRYPCPKAGSWIQRLEYVIRKVCRLATIVSCLTAQVPFGRCRTVHIPCYSHPSRCKWTRLRGEACRCLSHAAAN